MNALSSMIPDTNTYNGWKNWATYNVARRYDRYDALIPRLELECGQMTPDGARWMDPTIDTAALDEMLADL